MSKYAKYADLKHHFPREFTKVRCRVQQGIIQKAHEDHSIAGISTKSIDTNTLKYHDIELDLDVPFFRERFYGENGIFN